MEFCVMSVLCCQILYVTEKCALHRMVSVWADCCSSEGCIGRRLHGIPCTRTLATRCQSWILLAAGRLITDWLQHEGRCVDQYCMLLCL